MSATSRQPRQARKQVRPKLRADLVMAPQRIDHKTCYVLKDPIRLRYYRFTAQEHFLLERLDGAHTIEDLRQEYEQQHRPQRLSIDEVESFLRQLVHSGLVGTGAASSGRALLKRGRKHKRSERWSSISNLLAIRIPLFDPDRFLAGLLPWLSWLFTPAFAVCSAIIVLAALLLVGMRFDQFMARLPDAHEFFTLQTALYLWLALGAVKIVHEIGHGLTCKAFGGEVHETGLMFLCLAPCLYCEVSDSWTLPSKWRRMLIGFAGIYVELLVASLATFVWWHSAAGSALHQLSLCLMLVCSVNTLLFNGNPLLRYDGYFVLADWLEIPNLRAQSKRVVKHHLMKTALGIDVPLKEKLRPGRHLFLFAFGLASSIYLTFITVGVLCFIHRFLEPYKLQALTWLFGLGVVGSMVVRSVHRWARMLRERGRLPHMNVVRLIVSACVLGALTACFFLLPLPVSQVRQVGLVQVRPDAVAPVCVKTPGVLTRLHVRNGQRVAKGDLIAEFRNLDIETLLAESQSERDIRRVEYRSMRDRLEVVPDDRRAELEIRVGAHEGEQARYTKQVRHYEQVLETLRVRAPRDGVVMGLPDVDRLGQWWQPGPAEPLCTIAEIRQLEIVLPVEPEEYRRIRADLQQTEASAVAVRLSGWAGQTFVGKITALPESEARDVPLALAQQGGGPLNASPTKKKGRFVPMQQHFLIGVALEDPPATLCPGALATVVVRCRWQPVSWWVWNKLSSIFDLGLLA